MCQIKDIILWDTVSKIKLNFNLLYNFHDVCRPYFKVFGAWGGG